MAEALARDAFGNDVRVQSAGSSPTRINPFTILAMQDIGLDLGSHHSKAVDSIDLQDVDLVVTLCHEEACPTIFSNTRRLHWPLSDPDRKNEDLSDEERLEQFKNARDQIKARIEVLAALRNIPQGPEPLEFHASIRVPNLPEATRFYSWLLKCTPKAWTHRFVTFVSEALRTNFVILVDDGKPLHHDTLYHLGVDVGSKAAVIAAQRDAKACNWTIHKPARTTWRGTPLHELWLKDPGGNLVEIYARLSQAELSAMPEDQEPVFL